MIGMISHKSDRQLEGDVLNRHGRWLANECSIHEAVLKSDWAFEIMQAVAIRASLLQLLQVPAACAFATTKASSLDFQLPLPRSTSCLSKTLSS